MQQLDPQNIDIFNFGAAVRKTRPSPPMPQIQDYQKQVKPDNGRVNKELLEKAKAHHEQTLCRKIFKRMISWTRHLLIEKQKKEQEMHEKQKMQMMLENAIAVHNRLLSSKFFLALRDHAARKKNERAQAEISPIPVLPEPVPEIVEEEFSFVARAPSVEKKYFALEDARSLKLRSNWLKLFGLEASSPFDELDCMEFVFGRNRLIVCRNEYDQNFANCIELRSIPSPTPSVEMESRLDFLDEATLQKMKREKLAGGSNLFDVPQEFIYPSSSSNGGFDVEYRTREKARGIVNSST